MADRLAQNPKECLGGLFAPSVDLSAQSPPSVVIVDSGSTYRPLAGAESGMGRRPRCALAHDRPASACLHAPTATGGGAEHLLSLPAGERHSAVDLERLASCPFRQASLRS